MDEKLHTKYRPKDFKDVVGQDAVIKSLRKTISDKKAQVFLFHGPSGCGKTTLARICAKKFGCASSDLIEVDAATNTGVDNVRLLQEKLTYVPLSGGGKRAIILDEAHMLSNSAWNSLLKVLEDTPRHVVWFLCTTEFGKVPKTVKTRSFVYGLKSVSFDDLKSLVDKVSKEEGFRLPKGVAELVVGEADGSPRQALVNLGLCSTVSDMQEASTLLSTAIGSAETIDLCRLLVSKSCTWQKAMTIVLKLEDNPESVRIVVCNYVSAVLMKSKNKGEAQRLLAILEAFRGPYNMSEKKAPLLLSLGELLM